MPPATWNPRFRRLFRVQPERSFDKPGRFVILEGMDEFKAGSVLERFFISPGHNYFRHRLPIAGQHPLVETREIACVAGAGIEGDRFFNYKADYRGQITFFAVEVHEEIARNLQVQDRGPEVFRRNVITRGIDLNA